MKNIVLQTTFPKTRFLGRVVLKNDFSKEVLLEAERISLDEKIFKNRKEVQGVAIDKATTLDRDDAISVGSIEKNPHGGWMVEVHIADVGAVIKPGMAMDREANLRGETIYLGHKGNIPMIVPKISERLLSLGGDTEKTPTLTFKIPISKEGKIGSPKVEKTFLKGNNKITYDEANEILNSPEKKYHSILQKATEIVKTLRKISGKPINKITSTDIVHEFMVLANQSMAEFCRENNIPILYRNHKQDSKAYYSPIPEGHEGLGVEEYAYFTSPLRRNADRLNHQNLTDFLEGKKFSHGIASLEKKAEILNRIGNTDALSKMIRERVHKKIGNTPYKKILRFPLPQKKYASVA